MKKLIAFTMIALIVAIGIAIVNPSSGYTAPKDGNMRVWVEFHPGRKGAAQAALNSTGAQFHYTFDELNSFVVTLPSAALQGISRNPNVVSIEEDVPRYFIAPEPSALTESGDPYTEEIIPYGIEAVQALQVWDTNGDGTPDQDAPKGEGITVCIIDSGFYSDHEDLDASYVVGGISQVGGDYQDAFGHGSHVAGTISAMENSIGVVGVTPGTVNFYIVKIFADDGLWVSGASDLVAGIYECRDNGADIINMSLGGGSSNRKEQRAFDSVYASGVLSIAAAGNDAVSDPHYPASYASVVSVSAIDSENQIASFSNYGDHVELAAPGVGVMSTVPFIDESTVTVDGEVYKAFHIEFSAVGSASGEMVDGELCGTSGSGWEGKVVLCERGDYTFAEKVLNVQNSGGAAAIIYNNIPGSFSGTMGDDTGTIVALALSQEDGQDLVENKPGVTADLYGSIIKPASGYESWDGTSMATPHVAGVAALIWSSDPENLTNEDIREAMVETAFDIDGDGWDQYFGYGLVQAADALAYLGGEPVNEAPDVAISSPADGANFDSGAAISFSGSADDLEDGDLSAALVWTSSIDGKIGNGASFDTATLSIGVHTITTAATDSGGKTGSDSIDITVGDPGNEHPIVKIDTPEDGAIFDHDEEINFSGSATDDNDGPMSDDLIWTSSEDGPIGTGASFSTLLSSGDHTITATATDSAGETGSDSINIIVVEGSQENSIRVGAIDMSYSHRGRNYTIYTTVTILDADQNLVSGATVYLDTNGTATSGVTGTDGTVTLSISTRNTGLYTSTVTNVTHPTFEYNSGANEEDSETLPVP